MTGQATGLYYFDHEFLKVPGRLSQCSKDLLGKDGDFDGSYKCAGLVNRLIQLDFAEMLLGLGSMFVSGVSARSRPCREKASRTLQPSLASLMLKWSRCLGDSAHFMAGSIMIRASLSSLRNCTAPVLVGYFLCFDKRFAGGR